MRATRQLHDTGQSLWLDHITRGLLTSGTLAHYADAYLRGVERRIVAGLDPAVGSVASLFISRWDKATLGKVPDALRDRRGIAVAQRTYTAYRELLDSERWLRLANAGARPQRLLWASTGTKDPAVPDTLYVRALAAPLTINTMPEETLLAFAEHGQLGPHALGPDAGDSDAVIEQFRRAGFDDAALAARLQEEGAQSFVQSWDDLLDRIAQKSEQLQAAV